MKRGEVARGSAWALVTGAGSGIGSCYAQRLAALGYNLALVGNKPEPLQAIAEKIRATLPHTETAGQAPHDKPLEVRTIQLDLARPQAAGELFARTQAEGIAVDVLVNDAGIFSFCDILTTPAERIERMVMLHILTVTQLCRLYGNDMVRRGVRGHILNMSSYSLWMPFPGLSLYSASKAYVHSFSVAFAKEVREHGIRVTAVCPAGVATDFFGLEASWKRFARRIGVLITPDTCAKRALRALWRGRKCVIPDWWNRALIPICKALPMWALRPIRRFTMKFQK